MSAPGRDSTTIVVVQTTIPDYRRRFFESLSEKLGSRLVLLSGDEDWSRDVKHTGGVPYIRTRNVFLARRQLMWQSGALRHLLAAEVAVLGLNPRLVTCWVALVLRRVRRRRTVLWGHAWPRVGMRSSTDIVRGAMRRLADALIVYTETEARQLRSLSPGVEVVAAPNALYSRRELEHLVHADSPADFVFVGRLSPSKKPGLLLEAFLRAEPELADDVRLVFVGDGPLRERLESRTRSAGLSDRVVFAGHVSSLEELRRTYSKAIASVSPGYAGLSLIQSLGFGVPMLIAREEPHAPEIEAAVEGENSVLFPPDSPSALASVLVDTANRRGHWASRRALIAEPMHARYCIENMVESFVGALSAELGPVSDPTGSEARIGSDPGGRAEGTVA